MEWYIKKAIDGPRNKFLTQIKNVYMYICTYIKF